MKRKEFIRNISLVGVGVTLTPVSSLFGNHGVKTYALPEPTIHIPHGNFSSSELKKLTIPELSLDCTVELFLRDGITEKSDDLSVYSFHRSEQLLQVGITRAGDAFLEGNIDGFEIDVEESIVNIFYGKRQFRLKRSC